MSHKCAFDSVVSTVLCVIEGHVTCNYLKFIFTVPVVQTLALTGSWLPV